MSDSGLMYFYFLTNTPTLVWTSAFRTGETNCWWVPWILDLWGTNCRWILWILDRIFLQMPMSASIASKHNMVRFVVAC